MRRPISTDQRDARTKPPWARGPWLAGLPAGVVGLLFVLWGGRAFRLGLFCRLLGAWALLGNEAINIKAHDRLMFWVALGLFLSPAGERELTQKCRSPAPRWFFLIVFCSIYLSTGLTKLAHEPAWWNGEALSYHLLHRYHAGGPMAAWVSGKLWITTPLGWFTLFAESAFAFLVLLRRTNPLAIGMVFGLHLGIQTLMSVGSFNLVAFSAYPVLLHPEIAREWWEKWGSTLRRLPRHAASEAHP